MTVLARTPAMALMMRRLPIRHSGAVGVLLCVMLPLSVAGQIPLPPSAPASERGTPLRGEAAPAEPGGMAEPGVGTPIGSPVPGSIGAATGALSPEGAFRAATLGLPFGGETPAPEGAARTFVLTPSIAAQILGTDNVGQAATGGRSEWIATITPGMLLGVNAARIQGLLNYEPSVEVYGREASRPRVQQRFNGQFLATIVPDMIFLDMRGSAGTQAVQGGFAPGGETTVERNQLLQTTSFQVSPYLLHRFGDLATIQAGYAFQSVTQNLGQRAAGLTPDGQRFFTNQDFTAHNVYAVARTGPAFGRLAFEGRLNSIDYDGTGILDGAFSRVASVEGRYAVTRNIAVLAEVGYEMLRYRGVPGVSIEEPVWGVGARFTFSPESVITVRYARRGGFNSPSVNGVFAVGGRTRIFASYSETLSTGAQRAADLLSTTTLDNLGNPVDALTGAPVVQPFTDSFLGQQSSLQRVRRASVTISQTWPRDTFALTLASDEQRPVSVAPGEVGFVQRGQSVSVSWARALTPATTGLVALRYGRLERRPFGDSDVYGANVSLATQLRPGLNGFVRYGITNRGEDLTRRRAVQNVIVAGLRQTF